MSIVETIGLERHFGSLRAVDGLDLTVEPGDVFGLLGPNGAGKTTTIRMLTTLLAPSGGTALVCGFDVTTHPDDVRARVGYVMQEVIRSANLLTGRERLEIEASLYHLPRRQAQQRAAELLEVVGLTQHADRKAIEYSGGMQKRLDIAGGLLHRPELLVLDEPTLGLDVQSRHRVWEHINDMRAEGTSVLLATNYLDEADRLCNRLTIIDGGRAVVTGTAAELKRGVGGDVVQVSTADGARLRDAVDGQTWATRHVMTEDGDVHIYVHDAADAMPAVMRMSVELDIHLDKVTYNQPTLDDVFLLHTGHELREVNV